MNEIEYNGEKIPYTMVTVENPPPLNAKFPSNISWITDLK